MLALNSKFTLTALMTGLFMVSSVFGQQTPSQRFQPVRQGSNQNVPSVHVPPQSMQQLAPTFRVSSQGSGHYNLSDSNPVRPQRYSPQSTNQPAPSMNGQIQQASYQSADEPAVPAILRGSQTKVAPVTQVQTPQFKLPQFKMPQIPSPKTPQVVEQLATPPAFDNSTRKTPADFANAMNQVRNNGPRIAPNELANQQESISEQMAELRRRAEMKAEKTAQELAAKVEAEKQEIARLAAEREEAMRLESERLAAAKAEADRIEAERQDAIQAEAERIANQKIAERLEAQKMEADELAAQRREIERLKAERIEAERLAAQQLAAERLEIERLAEQRALEMQAKAEREISASEFIGNISGKSPVQTAGVSATRLASGMADRTMTSEPIRDTLIRQVSIEQDAEDEAAIKLAAPAIQVETFGPATVGVNKPATYQVVVKNNSSSQAERILVGINLPMWVDIENVNLTTGGKELTDGENQARLVWSIDKIPGNAAQTITVTAVPRKAEMFDVGVEWTLVPRVGKANVSVTEPKLTMAISGPAEVLYGETALYHVTVRNPGTGPAENVIVMLPEALGGERATLGNIEAGREKNFQVELLARTAGELNLIATAAGEQDLKTSAERALIVRRANLDVSLEGPGLKYAGSGAQYTVTINNTGDAPAHDVVTAVALPPGVKYLGGVDSVKLIEGGMRWPVGSLEPGQSRTFKVNCQLNTSGDLQLEVGARGKGDLAASSACLTTVETVADLVLTVADPKGPLPTGENVPYQIKVVNRGSKTAKGVNLVMQFSEGIEPTKATGLEHRIVPGQVLFNPISQIDPGQEMTFKVTAEAIKSGTHIFRAQLTCQDSDAREIAEGTTRFFGEQVQRAPATTATTTGSNNFGGSFQR